MMLKNLWFIAGQGYNTVLAHKKEMCPCQRLPCGIAQRGQVWAPIVLSVKGHTRYTSSLGPGISNTCMEHLELGSPKWSLGQDSLSPAGPIGIFLAAVLA